MSYEVYRYIFIIAAVLCAIAFVLSVFLFIFLKVPKLISDLTGITAKKAIKNIRLQNEATGDKQHKASAFNEARGKLTDKISKSGQLHTRGQSVRVGIDTSKIATQSLAVENQDENTTVLNTNETSVLDLNTGDTTVLSNSNINETSVLDLSSSNIDNKFEIEYEITFVHTEEIIESTGVGA